MVREEDNRNAVLGRKVPLESGRIREARISNSDQSGVSSASEVHVTDHADMLRLELSVPASCHVSQQSTGRYTGRARPTRVQTSVVNPEDGQHRLAPRALSKP